MIKSDEKIGTKGVELTKVYGVSKSAISLIKTGKSWSHLYHIYEEQ